MASGPTAGIMVCTQAALSPTRITSGDAVGPRLLKEKSEREAGAWFVHL